MTRPTTSHGLFYAYLRVSTEDQTASGLGLEAQRSALTGWGVANGWPSERIRVVADEGVSGTMPPNERPALAPILSRLGDGDVLGVSKLDRLGRTTYDVLGLARTASDEGWSLVVLDLGLDTSTPIGGFMLRTLASIAELERDLIAQRTREALARKRAQGARLGRPVTLPKVIRQRIEAEHTAGRSLSEIARGLAQDGVPTARGGQWRHSTVRAVLTSVGIDADLAS